MSRLAAMLEDPGAKAVDAKSKLGELARHLDALEEAARIEQVVALDKAAQARLWDLAGADATPLALDDLLPAGAPPLKPFPFEGRNSLPLFTRFRKVFYRTKDGRVGGYNDQSMGWLTGPGYYIARVPDAGAPGPLVIDYTQVPAEKPEPWPPIRPNERGLSSLVYGHMHDYLRRVARDVVIGRAWKHGKETSNYFVLCRSSKES